MHGGRYNDPGVDALYMSGDLMTAAAEYDQDLGTRPGTFCAYDVAVDGIVNLLDPSILGMVGTTPGDLRSSWKRIALIDNHLPLTWNLSRNLISRGHAGIRAPSTVYETGVNLVLWRWNDAPNRKVAALDPNRDLPIDQSSWKGTTR